VRTTHSGRRLPSWAIGLILIVVIAAGSFVAYTKKLPWDDPFEVQAVFETAQNLRPKAPVRIAGVQVGEVTKVEHLTSDDPELHAQAGVEDDPLPNDPSSGEQAAVVTMSLDESAFPLHEDAQMQLRPRLFLEGNLFLDLKPGSPNADEIEEGHTFPVQQTSSSVQIDQVLTTLQSDVRAQLQTFLDQFGNALIKYGGAEGFQEVFRSGTGAYKYTSHVNEALQGTKTHDLSGLIGNLDRVVAALDTNELALQNLVTNFRVVTGSFAAESASLEQAIAKLPDVLDAADPAFANLNNAFPPLRAFAREALPGVRSTAPTLRAATPFIEQVRKLVSQRELRGLVGDLRPTIPDLAKLADRTIPFLEETRALSSCFNEVVIPWSNDTVEPPASYPHGTKGTVAETTAYGLVGIAGESRSGDANGQYIRVQAGGGPGGTVVIPGSQSELGEDAFGLLDYPLLGALPRIEDSAKTPFKPRVDCETQEQPNLQAGVGDPPEQIPASASASPAAQADALGQIMDSLPDAGLLKEQSDLIGKLTEDGRTAAAERETKDLYEELADQFADAVEAQGSEG
jgi:phospholipid/cholesterol/gamma-HCH transport system substrate-binding protein